MFFTGHGSHERLIRLPAQDEGIESMENEGAYRAVLYTCVLAHWVTLLTAVAVAGTLHLNPLALLGASAQRRRGCCICCICSSHLGLIRSNM